MHLVLLVYYCVAIVAISVAGGLLPDWVRLTHRRTEVAVSFVAGTMLGVALLHMLPHVLTSAHTSDLTIASIYWILAGFLAMFFIERFFCFHHHDVAGQADSVRPEVAEDRASDRVTNTGSDCDHTHNEYSSGLTWSGAAMGLTLHSVLAGVALAASVCHAPEGAQLAGLGAFLAIALHKPLDAMTIAVLMARSGWSSGARCFVNALFALAVPLGILIFYTGVAPLEADGSAAPVSAALAFSVGVFLCVAMSDLLPELHFHDHDRLKLSVALLMGLAFADVARRFESHQHSPQDESAAVVTEGG